VPNIKKRGLINQPSFFNIWHENES